MLHTTRWSRLRSRAGPWREPTAHAQTTPPAEGRSVRRAPPWHLEAESRLDEPVGPQAVACLLAVLRSSCGGREAADAPDFVPAAHRRRRHSPVLGQDARCAHGRRLALAPPRLTHQVMPLLPRTGAPHPGPAATPGVPPAASPPPRPHAVPPPTVSFAASGATARTQPPPTVRAHPPRTPLSEKECEAVQVRRGCVCPGCFSPRLSCSRLTRAACSARGCKVTQSTGVEVLERACKLSGTTMSACWRLARSRQRRTMRSWQLAVYAQAWQSCAAVVSHRHACVIHRVAPSPDSRTRGGEGCRRLPLVRAWGTCTHVTRACHTAPQQQHEGHRPLGLPPPSVCVTAAAAVSSRASAKFRPRMRASVAALLRLLLAALAVCSRAVAEPPGNDSLEAARIHKVGYVKVRRRRHVFGRVWDAESVWRKTCTDTALCSGWSLRLQTHKTGSTTLGAALFRFGARNHLVRQPPGLACSRLCSASAASALPTHSRVAPFTAQRFYCQGAGAQPCRRAHIVWPGRPLLPGEVYDLQLNHFSGNGVLRKSFGHVIAWYKARNIPAPARHASNQAP